MIRKSEIGLMQKFGRKIVDFTSYLPKSSKQPNENLTKMSNLLDPLWHLGKAQMSQTATF